MSEISDKIIKDYRKNITIRDVHFYKKILWDYLTVKITDNNKKHFKNKTLRRDFYYLTGKNLNYYVEWSIEDYIKRKKGKEIRELESYQIIQEYKKETLE